MNNNNLSSSEKLVLSLSNILEDINVRELSQEKCELNERKKLILEKRNISYLQPKDKNPDG